MALPAPVRALITATGINPASAEHVLKATRPAGLLPMGSRRGNVEWTPRDLATFLLGASSPLAIESPDTIRAFASCTFLTSPGAPQEAQAPRCGPGTLLDVMERLIILAGRVLEAEETGARPPCVSVPYAIHFHLDPPRCADLVWLAPNCTRERTEVYAPASDAGARSGGAYRRSVTLDTLALIAAGRVWLDLLASQGTDLSPPTENENENAASLPGDAAPTRTALLRTATQGHDPITSQESAFSDIACKVQGFRSGSPHPVTGSRNHGCDKNTSPPSPG